MKLIGLVIFLMSVMLTATGEHWQNYLTMAIGIFIFLLGYKIERR